MDKFKLIQGKCRAEIRINIVYIMYGIEFQSEEATVESAKKKKEWMLRNGIF